MRVFVAIPLSETLRERLRDVQERIAQDIPSGVVRWVRPEQMHLTLKFLGEITPAQVERLHRAAQSTCRGRSSFPIGVEGLGCFPNLHRPRVVWVGLRDEARLLGALQNALEGEARKVGLPAEARPFSPHLTLGRVDRRATMAEARRLGERVGEMAIGTLGLLSVSEMVIMRSDLRPHGPVYQPLHTVSLSDD